METLLKRWEGRTPDGGPWELCLFEQRQVYATVGGHELPVVLDHPVVLGLRGHFCAHARILPAVEAGLTTDYCL
jgi:hypothetical protein